MSQSKLKADMFFLQVKLYNEHVSFSFVYMYLVVICKFFFLLLFVIVLICHVLTTKIRNCKIGEMVQTREFNTNLNNQKGANNLGKKSEMFGVETWEPQDILNVQFRK